MFAFSSLRRFWLFFPIMVVLVLFVSQGWHELLSLDSLRDQRVLLKGMVEDGPVRAVALYFLAYAVITACMVPGASILTISGGFLFGLFPGTLITVIAASCGATGLFSVARGSFGGLLAERAGPFMQRLEAGFSENAVSYMLILRFIPAVPFPVANIAPALFGARMRDFILTTFFGIIPGVFAYSLIGSGLGGVFDRGETPDLAGFTKELAPAFIALAVLALLPVVVKRFRVRRNS